MKRALACVLLSIVCLSTAMGQRRHEPLTSLEIDELRDARMEPENRIKLLVKFTQARMDAVVALSKDPKLSEKSEQLNQMLDDIATLVDEIDDNLNDYNKSYEDLRKPLRALIVAETDFQAKLTALKESSAAKLPMVSLTVANAMDSVDGSLESARAMLEDQMAKKGKEAPEKKSKKKERPDDSAAKNTSEQGPPKN